MNCSATIDAVLDGEFVTFISAKIRKKYKSKHARWCCSCDKPINPGEKYFWENVVDDNGRHEVHRTCLICKEIRDVFFESYFYDQVMHDFKRHVSECCCDGETLPESFLTQLSPEVQGFVAEMITDVWDDHGV